jgi:hypothetical protein
MPSWSISMRAFFRRSSATRSGNSCGLMVPRRG